MVKVCKGGRQGTQRNRATARVVPVYLSISVSVPPDRVTRERPFLDGANRAVVISDVSYRPFLIYELEAEALEPVRADESVSHRRYRFETPGQVRESDKTELDRRCF